jgi:calcineurin-like phosphoesterase family protein
MNETLITNWNNVVSKKDTVIHIGDFAFKQSEVIKSVFERLNGNIHILLGNHDNIKQIKTVNFASVREGFWDFSFFDSNKKEQTKVFLCHFPLLSWNSSAYKEGRCHLYGHVHTSPYRKYENVGFHPGSYDVGVDNNNFTPVLITDAIEKCVQQKEEKFGKETFRGYA